MRPDIIDTFGKELEREVTGLLEKLSGMTDIIEANFSQMKDIMERHKNELIKVIKEQKEKEIEKLNKEIKAKDLEINNLKEKAGELKAKDDMIVNLKKHIDTIQSQLDALAHRGDCHSQGNPLQSVVESLTAKIVKLENEIQSLKDKAAKEI